MVQIWSRNTPEPGPNEPSVLHCVAGVALAGLVLHAGVAVADLLLYSRYRS